MLDLQISATISFEGPPLQETDLVISKKLKFSYMQTFQGVITQLFTKMMMLLQEITPCIAVDFFY